MSAPDWKAAAERLHEKAGKVDVQAHRVFEHEPASAVGLALAEENALVWNQLIADLHIGARACRLLASAPDAETLKRVSQVLLRPDLTYMMREEFGAASAWLRDVVRTLRGEKNEN